MKDRQAGAVEGDDLAIKDSALCSQAVRNGSAKLAELFKNAAAPGHKVTVTLLDESEAPESVVFQFEQPIGAVEGLGSAGKPYGA